MNELYSSDFLTESANKELKNSAYLSLKVYSNGEAYSFSGCL